MVIDLITYIIIPPQKSSSMSFQNLCPPQTNFWLRPCCSVGDWTLTFWRLIFILSARLRCKVVTCFGFRLYFMDTSDRHSSWERIVLRIGNWGRLHDCLFGVSNLCCNWLGACRLCAAQCEWPDNDLLCSWNHTFHSQPKLSASKSTNFREST